MYVCMYIAKDGCIYRELYGSIYASHANYLCREEEVPLERGEKRISLQLSQALGEGNTSVMGDSGGPWA